MIIITSLAVSLIGFILMLLTVERAEELYLKKDENAISKKVPLIHWIRFILMFLIPFLNIALLLTFAWCFIFAKDEWFENKIFSELKK